MQLISENSKILQMVENQLKVRHPEFAERVQTLAVPLGIDINAIKEALDCSYEAARRYWLGIAKPRDNDQMIRLARLLRTTPSNLEWSGIQQKVGTYNVEHARDPSGELPEISWVAAGKFAQPDGYDPYCDMITTHPRPHNAGKNAFALRVRGISNENLGARLTYSDGDIIFVSRDRAPKHGDMVIVLIDGANDATFKQLVEEAGNRYLRPLNPAWPEKITPISQEATIIGVVIGRYIPS